MLMALALLAAMLVYLAVQLRAHADERRQVVNDLTGLQVEASGQHTLVWRAMTQLMAEQGQEFNRTRALGSQQRRQILARLGELEVLVQRGDEWNRRLGVQPDPREMTDLRSGTERFLAGVQGAFGMMSLSRDSMRRRLRHWDMHYGVFQQALDKVRDTQAAIAARAATVANQVSGIAAVISLLACLWVFLRLSRFRARQQMELQAEHVRTLTASESRFRGLVQHSTDLILALDHAGQVRYASPSACQLLGLDESAQDLSVDIEALVGLSLEQLLSQQRVELRRETSAGACIIDVLATDLSGHPDVQAVVLNGRDVTEARQLQDKLRHQALHDPLTGLSNRRQFLQRFDALSDAERRESCVLFIDLDGFKKVNDSFGHRVGDQLLIHTASRIGTCLERGDLLVRQGGDEFLVLCRDSSVAERIQQVLAAPFEIGRDIAEGVPTDHETSDVFISASIGIVTDLSGLDAEQAAQRADIAMYRAKQAGKAQAVTFSEDMLSAAPEQLALEADFRRALANEEFTVVYQPKVGLKSGHTESLEALVRWIHPTRGFVGPDLFVPFAEESGLVHELGRQVLFKACDDAVRWQAMGVVVAVNLSPIQFRNPRLVDEVQQALLRSGLEPRFLELEITESAVLGDVQTTIRVMRELKALGVRLAIDDFGTGYSNLAHLKHFDVDVLKIDQAFVRGEGSSDNQALSDGAIVEAVIGMARAFDMHVVAEGVESSAHADELRRLGADLGQGYYFSKPVDGAGIDAFLQAEVNAGRRARNSADFAMEVDAG